MADDLIQRLRDCLAVVYTPCNQIEAAALELGQSGTSEAVDELTSIADGGRYITEKRGKKHWWSRSETVLSEGRYEHNFVIQRIAIEALGETQDDRALEYLTKFAEWQLIKKQHRTHYSAGEYRLEFPNAKGELKNRLVSGDGINPRFIPEWDRDKVIEKGLLDYKTPRDLSGDTHFIVEKGDYALLLRAIKRLKATTVKQYAYTCYNIDKNPTMFDGAHRRPEYGEKGDITCVILHPSQPWDDDSMLLKWNSEERRWNMSFSLGLGGGEFPEGEHIGNGGYLNERAGLTLLNYFYLTARRNEFSPEKLGYLSPEQLQKLGNAGVKNFLPNQ